MKHLSSYAKVFAIGHPQITDIFKEDVIAEEKIDGSQFSFGNIGGEFVCRSRGQQIQPYNVQKLFQQAFDAAFEIFNQGKLPEDRTVRCEYLQKPKHNTLSYNRIPKNHLIVYDVEDGLCPVDSWLHKEEIANAMGLETVPLLFSGRIETVDDVLNLLELESVLGGPKIEGIVFKNYKRFTQDAKYYVGKYVSEKFKEKHQKEWGKSNPATKDIIGLLCEEMRSEGRWMKAIQHLKEAGELVHEPKDIGPLIREIQQDIEAEEIEYIKGKLYGYAKKSIMGSAVKGFPEFYKKLLMDNSFGEDAA